MVVTQLGTKKKSKKPVSISASVYKPKKTTTTPVWWTNVATTPVVPTSPVNFWDTNPSQSNTGGGFSGTWTYQASNQSFSTQPTPVQGTQNFLMFGQNATGQESQSPWFLQKRNDYLAQDFLKKGIVDQSSIFEELNKNPEFASADLADKENTARAVYERIWQQSPVSVDTGNTDDYFNQIMGAWGISNQQANQFVDQAVGEYATGLEYGTKTAFDRPNENLQNQYDQAKLARKRQLEDLNTSISQQMDDVKMQAERNLGIVDKQGALMWFNRSSGYNEGRDNIKNDAQRAIDRLQALWDTASSRDEEDLANLTDQFNQATKRVKEDFDYQYRNLLEQRQVDLNTIVSKYGLSSDKLTGELQNLTVDTLQNIQNLENSYQSGLWQQISNVNSYLDTLQNQQKTNEIQFERTRNFLDQNDWENLTSISYKQIDDLVNAGQLSDQDAQLYRTGIANKAYQTLKSMGVPDTADVDFLANALEQGYTPYQVITSIIQNSPPGKFTVGGKQSVSGKFQYNPLTGRFDLPLWGARTGWGGGWGWASGATAAGGQNLKQVGNYFDLSQTAKYKSKIPQTTAENLAAGSQTAVSALNAVQDIFNEGKAASWILWEALKYSKRATNTKLANQQLWTAAQIVGKFLEGGKLAEWDIARYKSMLPDVGDTPEVAQWKLDNVKKLLVDNYNWQLDTYARWQYDVSNFNYIPSVDSVFKPSVAPATKTTWVKAKWTSRRTKK